MNAGNFPPAELSILAREAHGASGLTQAQAAEQMGVTVQSYNQALSPRAGLDNLRVRIIEAFTPYRVEGPEYRLVEKEGQAGADA